MDTRSLLERIKFVQALVRTAMVPVWDSNSLLGGLAIKTPDAIVAYLDKLLFQGGLSAENRALLVRFVSTDQSDNPLLLDPNRSDFTRRVQELVSLMLSAPQWHNHDRVSMIQDFQTNQHFMNLSRRKFLKAGCLTFGALGVNPFTSSFAPTRTARRKHGQ
jgi:hypothetical protein